ncbi:MAG: hypothetical protein MMC23_008199 [Stictis urceolatum]|nr:hypothetical protein [Stictis urceolata]
MSASSVSGKTGVPYNRFADSDEVVPKKSAKGVVLTPQPSDSLNDPLNWSMSRKVLITAIWSLGAFVSTASALGNTLVYFVQAKLYDIEVIEASYPVVAATVGIAFGPLFFVPLASKVGRSCMFLWSVIGLLVTGIWSAYMTHPNQYYPFLVSRLISGLFGGNSAALGSEVMVDTFFLHQRGKALTVLNLSFLFGVVIGPTFSGFIVQSAPWPVQYWWSVGLQAALVLASFVFLQDTYFDRDNPDIGSKMDNRGWLLSV